MSWLSGLSPVLGAGLGALLAAPTGGVSLGMGALIGGVAGSGVGSAIAADEANKLNTQMQNSTNDKSIELANTAHQREIKDLAAAGLNPILSAKYGGSATPSLTSPSVESLAPIISNSANQLATTSMGAQNLAADLAVKKATVLNSSAQAISTEQDARRKLMENEVLEAELPLQKYKSGERFKSRAWDLFIDDAKRGISVINPFAPSVSGGSRSH